MYKTIITIKDDVSEETLNKLHAIAAKAFCNRAGMAENASSNPRVLEFEGNNENSYGCLQLGIMLLDRTKGFKKFVSSWNWIDETEPSESCDVIASLAVPVR